MDFVFLHVGPDRTPIGLIESIHKIMPNSNVIQISDTNTKPLPNVDKFISIEQTVDIMMFRLEAFSSYDPSGLTVYLDTDMLVVQPIEENDLLGTEDVALCKRVFDFDLPFNTSFVGLDLSEYKGKSLGEVYPYIACCTVTRSNDFWRSCVESLRLIDPKFQKWYGDQEAMKDVISRGDYKFRELPESVYACLPDRFNPNSMPPKLFHFKGAARKKMLKDFTKNLLKISID